LLVLAIVVLSFENKSGLLAYKFLALLERLKQLKNYQGPQ
jgi:hypothetical protein